MPVRHSQDFQRCLQPDKGWGSDVQQRRRYGTSMGDKRNRGKFLLLKVSVARFYLCHGEFHRSAAGPIFIANKFISGGDARTWDAGEGCRDARIPSAVIKPTPTTWAGEKSDRSAERHGVAHGMRCAHRVRNHFNHFWRDVSYHPSPTKLHERRRVRVRNRRIGILYDGEAARVCPTDIEWITAELADMLGQFRPWHRSAVIPPIAGCTSPSHECKARFPADSERI